MSFRTTSVEAPSSSPLQPKVPMLKYLMAHRGREKNIVYKSAATGLKSHSGAMSQQPCVRLHFHAKKKKKSWFHFVVTMHAHILLWIVGVLETSSVFAFASVQLVEMGNLDSLEK